LRSIIPQIRQVAAELVVIGNGTAQQAQWFLEATGLDTPVYTDPDRHVYRAIGARRSLLAFLHPKVILRYLQAWRNGFQQTGKKGDATQLGGTLIVRPDGSIPYLHRSAYAGDTPKPATILNALQNSTQAGPAAVVR